MYKHSTLEAAIKQCLADGRHPSAIQICKRLGRSNHTLRGDELVLRRKIFKELGIELKGGPYAKNNRP